MMPPPRKPLPAASTPSGYWMPPTHSDLSLPPSFPSALLTSHGCSSSGTRTSCRYLPPSPSYAAPPPPARLSAARGPRAGANPRAPVCIPPHAAPLPHRPARSPPHTHMSCRAAPEWPQGLARALWARGERRRDERGARPKQGGGRGALAGAGAGGEAGPRLGG